MNQDELLIGPPPKKASEINPIQIQQLPTTNTADLTMDLISKIGLKVAQNEQMKATREVDAGYRVGVSQKLKTLKENAINSGDYTRYRTEAKKIFDDYYSKMNRGAFYREAIDNIKPIKEQELELDILTFEANAVRAAESEKLSQEIREKREDVVSDPSSVYSKINELNNVNLNISAIAGTPQKASEIMSKFKNHLATAAIESSIDNSTVEDAEEYINNLNQYLTPRQTTAYKNALKKKSDLIKKVGEMQTRFDAIMNGSESISPNDKEATNIIDKMYSTNPDKYSAIDIASKTNYIPKKFLTDIEANMFSGGKEAIKAAKDIENLEKLGKIVARQISMEDRIYSERFLNAFRNTGDLKIATDFAGPSRVISKEEMEIKMKNKKFINSLDKKISSIFNGNVGSDEDYDNPKIRAEFQRALSYYYIDKNMKLEPALEAAKKEIQDGYGLSKYTTTSWWSTREETFLTRMPIEENNGAPKEERNKDWFLLQYKLFKKGYLTEDGKKVPGKKIPPSELKLSSEDYINIAFKWTTDDVGNGADKQVPSYHVFEVDKATKGMTVLEHPDGEPVKFTPNYSSYKNLMDKFQEKYK